MTAAPDRRSSPAAPNGAAPLHWSLDGRRAGITLDDPARRNALGRAMFDGLARALDHLEAGATDRAAPLILRIRGHGPAFCAGFDLDACAGDGGQAALGGFITALSAILRRIRRGPWVAIAEVHGPALAGGCALAAACDFVLCADDALLGYPVHRLGVSPAVNAPVVAAHMGHGEARALLLSGECIDGREARRRGLAWRACPGPELAGAVDDLVDRLLLKGPRALAATRRWLNELDGSDRDDLAAGARDASLALCGGDESVRMLREFRAAQATRAPRRTPDSGR